MYLVLFAQIKLNMHCAIYEPIIHAGYFFNFYYKTFATSE